MKRSISALFVLAAVYDGLLGLIGLFFGSALFGWFGVTPPNHWGYVQFPGALLVVFAIMFFAVAANPARTRHRVHVEAVLPRRPGLPAAVRVGVERAAA